MRLTVPHRCILCKYTAVLVVFSLAAACSPAPSPTASVTLLPQDTPTPTTTPALSATPSVTGEPPTPNPSVEARTLTTELIRDIVYAEVDNKTTTLDVYAPSQDGPWPVVVVVPGYSETKFGKSLLADTIASRGAVVYNIDVAFIVPFLIGIERLACAIRFARVTAPDYHGDPGRITIVGDSAGAAAGVVVGLAGDDFEEDCVVSDVSALPDALVAFEGPYEFVTTNYGYVVDHTYLSENPLDAILLGAIDPYTHIGRNPDLQICLIHGDDVDDDWYEVTPEELIEMHRALVDAGYDVKLFLVEGATHLALASKSEVFALAIEQVMELASSLSQ